MKDILFRSLQFNRDWLDEKNRQATLSFSSETEEVNRYFGDPIYGKAVEILDHSSKAADLKRLRDVGAYLFNHNPSEIIGPIKTAKIENGRGVAVVGYDDTEEGNKAFERTKSGSLKGVSFGYRVKQYKKLEEGEEYQLATRVVRGKKDIPVMIATKWEAIEITATPIPADSSIGIGRELTRALERMRFNDMEDFEGMDETRLRELIREEIRAAMGGQGDQRSIINNRGTVNGFTAEERGLMDRASAVSTECQNTTMDMILEGRSVAEIERHIHQTVMNNCDAKDNGGDGGDGTKRNTKKSFSEIDDRDFAEAFQNMDEFGLF